MSLCLNGGVAYALPVRRRGSAGDDRVLAGSAAEHFPCPRSMVSAPANWEAPSVREGYFAFGTANQEVSEPFEALLRASARCT